MSANRPHVITSVADLEALFGPVGEASLRKEVPTLHPHYQALIKASPFAVLATVSPDGLDVSPRAVPTPGEMLEALTQPSIDGAAYDRESPQRQRTTLY
jgi:predicted pyridoxine 5'-phosphate oxidase superfamily flavin-nucleotide-binding protein